MAGNDEFHLYRREWSDRKHLIVRDYLAAAARILGTQAGEVFFVDGFAGQGFFDDGTPQSSVLSALLALATADKGKYLLRCINVEADPAAFIKLQAATSPIAPGLVTNLQGSFADRVPEILKMIGNQPAVVFLDPFGVKEIPWNAIAPLLARKPKTDVIVNFMGAMAARLAGFVNSPTARQGTAMIARLDSILGDTDWHGAAMSAPQGGLRKVVCDEYRSRLVKVRGFACDFGVKSAERQYKYTIMFATRHPLPLKISNDIFCNTEHVYEAAVAERRERRKQEGPLQASFFEDARPSEAEVEQDLVERLKPDVISILQEQQRRLAVQELRLLLWRRDWFGKAKSALQDRAVRELFAEGKIGLIKARNPESSVVYLR